MNLLTDDFREYLVAILVGAAQGEGRAAGVERDGTVGRRAPIGNHPGHRRVAGAGEGEGPGGIRGGQVDVADREAAAVVVG